MADWTDGYITDTDYTSHFYAFLAPSVQNLALLLQGVAPVDLSTGYTYCELGCGQGYSTALLAAANPEGRFWGVDFNPSHIAKAERTRSAAGIPNLRFLEKSFAEMAGLADLPAFDFIALHGVWSWINAANRAAISAFLYEKLKPGGVVYISYNAMPGWASSAPLRQLLVESQRQRNEVDLPALGAGLALARAMKDAGARYFSANPASVANLDAIASMPPAYVMHEYLNRDWQPSYFSEVAAEMKAAKLSFAGSNNLIDQFDQVCLTPAATAILKDVTDPAARETIRDYFLNTRFRRDQFTRGARRLSTSERSNLLQQTRFVLAAPMPSFPLQWKVPIGTITVPVEPAATVARLLAEGPLTLGALQAAPDLAAHSQQVIFQAILTLTAQGILQVAMPQTGAEARAEAVARFNRAVMLQPLALESAVLASSVLGNGTAVPQLDQILLALEISGKAGSPQEVLAHLDAGGIRLRPAGADPGPNTLEAVSAVLQEFRTLRRPVYRRLGVF